MEKQIKCGMCKGFGYDREFVKKSIVFTDCPQCKGFGKVKYKIIDKRKNHKKRLEMPYHD